MCKRRFRYVSSAATSPNAARRFNENRRRRIGSDGRSALAAVVSGFCQGQTDGLM
jgi:hypothetical protein